ncbi:MAG: HEPN domain-containing protein [Acidimicrobiaceae bacterium]|nr:HEPN domain-containing protein [Acidimicrobiaceae bacterium]
MTTRERHQEICEQFLAHAEEEYGRGDYLQAAEKAWGAFAHCMNAIAIDEGWEVGSHRKLIANAKRLIDRQPEHAKARRLLLAAVESLHVNFYKEFMSQDAVRDGIDNAGDLIKAVKGLASQ